LLSQLALSLEHDGSLPGPDKIAYAKPGSLPKGRIFKTNGKAFTQAFGDVVRRAKIVDLRFHDLRTEANTSLFYKAGLDPVEQDLMLGHEDKTRRVARGYLKDDDILAIIQDKLDRYQIGKTMAEAEAEHAEQQQEFEGLCEQGLREGLTREQAIEKATAIFSAKPEWVELRAMFASLPSRQVRLAEGAA